MPDLPCSGFSRLKFEPSGRRIGDYLLGPMIGSGGMGSVYLAKQIPLPRLVALKLLRKDYASDPDRMERFFHEVRMTAKLEAPGIVRAIEAGMDNGIPYFAMEFVPGMDLKSELRKEKRLSERVVLSAARDVSRAMMHAWLRHGMIHRDIKPSNVMHAEDGSFKLLDFGISKQVTEPGGNGSAGSPVYASPEQAANNTRTADFRSDIYSLGVTMYHLLAGVPPYDSSNPVEVLAMHFYSPIPDLHDARQDLLPGTERLIRWMMAKRPEDRPGSWKMILRQCEMLLAQREEQTEDPFSTEIS